MSRLQPIQQIAQFAAVLAIGAGLGSTTARSAFANAASICPALKQAQYGEPFPSQTELSTILEQGADPSERCTLSDNPSVESIADFRPLHLLLSYEKFALAQAVLEAGADVNARNGRDQTPLFFVGTSNGEPDLEAEAIAQRLLDQGADPNARDDRGLTPLHDVFNRHSLSMTELLLAAGARADVASNGERLTPLHLADQSEVAAALIRAGADVNAQTGIGFTPLHYAVSKRDPQLVRLLIEAGADWRIANGRGNAPIHSPGATPQAMTALLEAGVDANLRQVQTQKTALHIHNLNPEVTEILLANGAAVNAQDSLGRSPLHDSNPQVAAQLIAAGADINLQDNQGQTPLHRAIIEEAVFWGPEMAALLASQGADLTLQNNQGQTALDLARTLQKNSIVTLLESGASPTFTDTQFHWATACIDGMRGQGLLKGYGDRSFRPDGTMTRAEFAAVMIKAFPNRPVVRSAPVFADVPQGHWARAAIATAYKSNFLSGYPGNRFRPSQSITRAQALTILANTQGLEISPAQSTVLTYFDDRVDIPDYAKGAIAAATRARLVVNYPTVTQLRPGENLTRAEAAAFLCQAQTVASDGALEPRYAIPTEYVAVPAQF